jgi:SH3 domain-containing YSC84-like protein 1
MNFRSEAENRVERQRLNKLLRQERQSGISNRNSTRRSRHLMNIDLPTDSTENLTPKIAALAETDYSLNGRRARCTSGEFVGPRWIPDKETLGCLSCRTEFDWWTRRHHCRKCGKIFCGQCSSFQSLLPYDFGLRNPQRVCGSCFEELLPQQNTLTTSIANHAQTNTIDILSYSLRRYFNFPIALTLGSEIRKAGYSTYNLCRQLYYIRDKTIPLGLLSNAKGLVFITVLKGGFMFAPHFGTGLIVSLLPDGTWSAPSAIATCGISYGALIGAAVVDYVLILSNYDSVAAFAGGGQVSVGGSIDLVVGPLGR